jgi:hypothetical protein
MKAKFGTIMTDGRGKLGGSFISRNAYGSYVGNKRNGGNVPVKSQLRRRRYFAELTRNWRSLTDAQRDAWNAAVSDFSKTDIFGDLRNPSGFNLYMRVNYTRLELAISLAVLPPVNVCRFSLTEVGLYVQTNPSLIQFTWSPVLESGMSLFIWATRGMSQGRAFDKKELVYMRDYTSVGAGNWNATSQYTNRLGTPPPAGTKIFSMVQMVDNSNGIRGNSIVSSTICVSL